MHCYQFRTIYFFGTHQNSFLYIKADWSWAEIGFDVPKTPNPIVIYGMKGLRLPDLEYNSIHECPFLQVQLKTVTWWRIE